MKMIVWMLVLIVAGIIVFYFLQRRKEPTVSSEQLDIPYGPFVIEAAVRTVKTLNMNYGTSKVTEVHCSVWYE